ncbi:MAG: 3-dehydroquinate synthase [Casimicrobiaceae bacterium]|nr:3-dehydroquinate synthase [Casimicrobiaceae bacterium]
MSALPDRATTLTVSLFDRSYPIAIGPGLIGEPACYARATQGTWALVTNTTVAPLYAEAVRSVARRLGRVLVEVILPDGEAYKNAESLDRIYSALLEARCDRKTTIIALGGGVIGDLAGFAAATYQRGIPFIQVPTTLLAQVDSSVGGKTGINHRLGKNMIGAFHQPVAVISDTAALQTLPPREYAAGLAEVVKHALIFDAEHFAELEAEAEALAARDALVLARVIRRSCELKAAVVAQDERETLGLRALLNLGHTFGHAIETETGYGTWLHGEAVAVGLVLAARFSAERGMIAAGEVVRIERLLARFGLPTRLPPLDPERLVEHMSRDKKNENGQVTLILLERLGRAMVQKGVPAAEILAFLRRARSEGSEGSP